MKDGPFATRRIASLMRGPLGALLQRSASVVVIGLLLVTVAARGAFADPGITERVSVASDGSQGGGWMGAGMASLSPDGRYVTFYSSADNLVPDDTNEARDVFWRDRETGETRRVSVASNGFQGNGGSWSAWDTGITADGRYVVFDSAASNLVEGDTNGWDDVFLHDVQTGVTECLSIASDGTPGDQRSGAPYITPDGRYVAFGSRSSNLVPNDTNSAYDIFLHDRTTGQTVRVSVASDGSQAEDLSCAYPRVTPDGRYVAFTSYASNLVPGDTNGTADVFVHDVLTGETHRISVAADGTQGNAWSEYPAMSADGRYVAFSSSASNLVPDDANGTIRDVFVHDRQAGATELVSLASDGTPGNHASSDCSISADGRYVAFASWASTLVPGDTNADYDVFVHDRATGETTRVSVASDGTEGDLASMCPAITADGRCVAFDSEATNLVPNDTNGVWDAFVHERWPLPQLPYQFGGFLPPLHDGTSLTSPDGPFKRGRTIPVKFQLLDSEGQLISDEEAQGLVAELAVFYEEPSNQGEPIDPGDNPGDVGDQFRYDADADLFIYNLSTKALVWYADYTYGLEVLIDGIKAAEVYFSLR